MILLTDGDQFGGVKREDEVEVQTGTAFVDFIGELFTAHFNGFLDFAAETLDQFSETIAESSTVVIRLADVQNEYRFVFFQNKPLFFDGFLVFFRIVLLCGIEFIHSRSHSGTEYSQNRLGSPVYRCS